MPNTAKTVSLLIPCYNCEEFIERTISQARNQSVPFSEIICYDDCSQDKTTKLLHSLGIRVIEGTRNMGSGFARNCLLKASECDFVHFHDADDPFHSEEFVEQLLPLAGANTIGFCQWLRLDTDGEQKVFHYNDVNKHTDFIAYLINNHIHLNAMLIPRIPALSFGGFPEWMKSQQDLGFNMRCAIAGLSFRLCRRVLASHVRNESSSTASLSKVKNHLVALQLVSSLFNEFPISYRHVLHAKFLYHAKSLALLGENQHLDTFKEFLEAIPNNAYSGGFKEKLIARVFGIRKALQFIANKRKYGNRNASL
jgi:glycosyltransferase involved in cell wall biosynthesis